MERVVIEHAREEGAGDGPRLTAIPMVREFQTALSGRRCLQIAKNEEDGFILKSQDLPITMLLRAGVAEAHRPARRSPPST
jgi:hypothetical protein